MKALLDAGADVDAKEAYAGTSQHSFQSRLESPDGLSSFKIPTVFVAEWRRLNEFSDFLNPGADFRGCTALHYAVLVDDLQLVKMLLSAGRLIYINPTFTLTI